MEELNKKFYLTSNIKVEKETPELRKEAASVIKLPSDPEKQPDLGYFSAVLVSTGTNLNGAHFLGSELLAAAGTVNKKALDFEHIIDSILGFISHSAFTTKDHERLNLDELAKLETASLDATDMHIHIGCVMFKDRFQEIYKDIKDGKYCVSMECYYKDFDIKVGDTIIPKLSAAAVGIDINDDSIYGKSAKIIKDGKEIASGKLVRVLRGICFSGVGIVENPANPASVVIDVASTKKESDIIINLTDDNNVTSKRIESTVITTNTDKDVKNVVVDDDVVSNNGEPASLDQAELLSSIKRVTSECVDSFIQRKQELEEDYSRLNRLRTALEKAQKTI